MRKAWWPIVLLLTALSAAPAPAQRRLTPAPFGNDGVASTDFLGGTDKAFAAAVDAQGRIVVAGYASDPADEEWDAPPSPAPRRYFALARYGADGALDASFGNGGRLLTPIGDLAFATSVLVDPAGRILAAGYTCRQGVGGGCDFAAARYLAGGKLDASFGSAGVVTIALPGAAYAYARAAALDAHGRLVLAGNAGADFALVRLAESGAPDASFGSGGVVTASLPPRELVTALLAAKGDALVAAASSRWDHAATLLRFLPDGSADPSFGTDGRVEADVPGATFDALAPAPGGRILAGGGVEVRDPVDGLPRDHFLVARYDAKGRRDASFGDGGVAVIDVSTAYAAPSAPVRGGWAAALQPLDGGIVAAAGTVWTDAERARFGTVFVDASGRPARTRGGIVVTDVRGTIAEARGIALAPGGLLVVAGAAQQTFGRADQSFDWAIAGYPTAAR